MLDPVVLNTRLYYWLFSYLGSSLGLFSRSAEITSITSSFCFPTTKCLNSENNTFGKTDPVKTSALKKKIYNDDVNNFEFLDDQIFFKRTWLHSKSWLLCRSPSKIVKVESIKGFSKQPKHWELKNVIFNSTAYIPHYLTSRCVYYSTNNLRKEFSAEFVGYFYLSSLSFALNDNLIQFRIYMSKQAYRKI